MANMADALDFSDIAIKEPEQPKAASAQDPLDFSDLGKPVTGKELDQPTTGEFGGSEFSRGIARGHLQITAGVANFLRLFGDTKTGAIKDIADRAMEEARIIPTDAGSVKDVLQHPTLAPSYVARVVGELAPQAVAAYLTGGIGTAVGRGLALGKVGMRIATGAGAAATSIPQEVGNMYEESGSKAAALAFGIPSGMLDALSAERIIGKVFRQGTDEAKKKAWRQIVRDTIKEIPKTAGVEGTTETIQEALAVAADKAADSTYQALTPENGWRMLESAVAGAIGGGVLGGGTELAQLPAQKQARNQRAEAIRLTRDIGRALRDSQERQTQTGFTRTPVTPQTDESGTVIDESGTTPVDELMMADARVPQSSRRLLRAPDRLARTPVTDESSTTLGTDGVTSPVDELMMSQAKTSVSQPVSKPTPWVVVVDNPDRKVYEIRDSRNSVQARFDVVLDGNGVWRPTTGSGFEIFDKKLRGLGIGEKFVRYFAGHVGQIASTGLTPEEGTSEDALKMWKRIGAPIEELPNTDPSIGSKRAYVLRKEPENPEPSFGSPYEAATLNGVVKIRSMANSAFSGDASGSHALVKNPEFENKPLLDNEYEPGSWTAAAVKVKDGWLVGAISKNGNFRTSNFRAETTWKDAVLRMRTAEIIRANQLAKNPTSQASATQSIPASRLVPVLVTASGQTYPGLSHADALQRAMARFSQGQITPEEFQAVMEAQQNDVQHQFMDVQTKQVYDRAAAGQAIGFNSALDSQNLSEEDKQRNLDQINPKPAPQSKQVGIPTTDSTGTVQDTAGVASPVDELMMAQPRSSVSPVISQPAPSPADLIDDDKAKELIALEKENNISPTGKAKLDAWRAAQKEKKNVKPAPPILQSAPEGLVKAKQAQGLPTNPTGVRPGQAPSGEVKDKPPIITGPYVYDRSTLKNKFNMSDAQLANVKPSVTVVFDQGMSKKGVKDNRQAEQRQVFISLDSKSKAKGFLLIQDAAGETIWKAPVQKLVEAGIITKFQDEFGAGFQYDPEKLLSSKILERVPNRPALEGYKLPDERAERSQGAAVEDVASLLDGMSPFLGETVRQLIASGDLTSANIQHLGGMKTGGAKKGAKTSTKLAPQIAATFRAMIDQELNYARQNLANLTEEQKMGYIDLARYRANLESNKQFQPEDVAGFAAWLANSREFQIAKTDTELVSLEEVSGTAFGDNEGGGGEAPDSNPVGATWDPARTDNIIGTIEDRDPKLYQSFSADPENDKAWAAIEENLVTFLKGDRASAEILAEAIRAKRMEGWIANLGKSMFTPEEIKAIESADIYSSKTAGDLHNEFWKVNPSIANVLLGNPGLTNRYISLNDRLALAAMLRNGSKEKVLWAAYDKNGLGLTPNGLPKTRLNTELFQNAFREGSVFQVSDADRVIPVVIRTHKIHQDRGTYGFYGGQDVLGNPADADVRIQKPDMAKLEEMFPDAEDAGGPPLTFADSNSIVMVRDLFGPRISNLGTIPTESFEDHNWLTGISAQGHPGIKALLENRSIQLDPELRRIGLALLNRVHPKYFEGLTFSIAADGTVEGEFIPWLKTAKIAMHATNPETAAHEMAHYLAQFLTAEDRTKVATARQAELAIYRQDPANAEFIRFLDEHGGSATSAEYAKWKTGRDVDPNAIQNQGTPFRFVTSTELALRDPQPFGIVPDKNGFIAKQTLLAKLKTKVAKEELAALQPLLNQLPDRVNARMLADRIQRDGPQLEVVKLDARPQVKETAQQRYAAVVHELDTLGWKSSIIPPDSFASIMSPDGMFYRDIGDGKYQTMVLGQLGEVLDFDSLPEQAKKFYTAKNESIQEGWTQVDNTQNDSATFNYQFVNPKPLRDMPGAVDILVRVPWVSLRDVQTRIGDFASGTARAEYDRLVSEGRGVKFEGGHFGNADKNIVGWVRGYIETLPSGERVFHVFEVQSDWARQDQTNRETVELEGKQYQSEDPILAYYESAALKAAIRHARELGITKIAISDSETAALTEGHDKVVKIARDANGQNASRVIQDSSDWLSNFSRIIKKEATIPHSQADIQMYENAGQGLEKYRTVGEHGELVGGGIYHLEEIPGSGSEPYIENGVQYVGIAPSYKVVIDKEPFLAGDRQHYDHSLPGIMRKLTGEMGTQASFGQHQNVIGSNGSEVQELPDGRIVRSGGIRKDLISPKTDVSARVFDISRIDSDTPAQMFRSSLWSVTDPDYHLINDDEYFAHYMSEAAGKAPPELGGLMHKVKDFLRQMLDALKAWAGNKDAQFNQLLRKFERGEFLVHENGGMLFERNNSEKPKSLPPISKLKELSKYRQVEHGQEEEAFVNTLAIEQNQPIVGHIIDQLKALPRAVRNELQGLIGRAAVLTRVSNGPRVAETPLKHYATIVSGLAAQEEARTLASDIDGLVEKIQKQADKQERVSQAEAEASFLESVAKDSISQYKNFLLSEQKRSRDEGVAVGLGEAIKALDAMKESTTSLKRAVEYMSELVSLEELNNPNLDTQQLVDLFKAKLRTAANVADWQQAVIPPGANKPGVSNEQLRIAVNIMRQNQQLVQDLLTYKELSDPKFASIMKEDGDYTEKQIASLTHTNLRSFLKTYYNVRTAKDRARKVYLHHRMRMKDLIEQLENKLAAEEFYHSQVLESPQYKAAMSEASQEFMSAEIVRDGNGNDVLKRTYYNPLNKKESVTIQDGTSKEDYEKNLQGFAKVQGWYEDALDDPSLDPLDKSRIIMELARIIEVEKNPAYDPQTGKRSPGPLNAPNILSNLTGNSLQFAMQKIGGRAAVQASAVFQARSEARRRVQEVRHDMQHRFQIAVLNAAKSHELTITRWVKEVAEPILASYNSIGAKPYKVGDQTQYGHRVSGADLQAVRSMKEFADAMNKASGDMDIQTAKLHPVRIKEILSGREITRRQQGHSELIMPRRFQNEFITILNGWRSAKEGKATKDALPQLAQYLSSGKALEEMLLAHIRSTQRYPDYANRTKFMDAYREIYRDSMNGQNPASFEQVVDKVFESQEGDGQLTKDEIAKAILFELDAMANKVLDTDASDRAADSPGTSTSVQSANNFMTKSRGEMIAPDSGYKYSLVTKADVQWITRSVLEVHEQMALDGLVKIKKMLEDYLRTWEGNANAQVESRKKQLSGEDWMNQREARQMLNQINRHIGLTSREGFNSFIDDQFGGIARKAWSILIQSLLQSATVLKNNFLGMNLRLWQNEAQWRGDGLWMGMPKWLLKLPQMAKNGIYWPMRDIPSMALSHYAYSKAVKKLGGEKELKKIIYHPELFQAAASEVGGGMLKRAVNLQRAKDLGAAGSYGLKEQVEKFIRMFTYGGELNVLEPNAWQKIKGGIESMLGLIQETGGGVMLPKALAPRKLEQLLNFQAIRYADRLLEELKLNILEANRARQESGRTDEPITDAELLGETKDSKANATHMRNIFNRAGLNLDSIASNMQITASRGQSNQDLLSPAQWNSFVLEIAKELNMPSSDNRVQYRSGFARLMSSLMGYGMWYNERMAEAMAANSRKKFDPAAVYRAMFFAAAIAAIGVGASVPLQRLLKKLLYDEEDQTGKLSADNTAYRNAAVLWEQTAPFWPIIGSVMSQFYDARSGGNKLFNFLPVTAAQQILQAGNEISQTGNVFYPIVKFAKLWLPNTKIILNRLPQTEGMINVNNAARSLRSVAAGDIELRTPKGGGVIKYSPTSTEAQMVVNEIAKPTPDMAAVEQYRKSAVDKLVGLGASRKDAERRFDLSVLARFPQNSVYGRTLTTDEYGQQVLKLNGQQAQNLASVENAFNGYATSHGLRAPGIPRVAKSQGKTRTTKSRTGLSSRRSGSRLVRNRSLVRRKRLSRLVRR